jgi:hypothetical protein
LTIGQALLAEQEPVEVAELKFPLSYSFFTSLPNFAFPASLEIRDPNLQILGTNIGGNAENFRI